MNYQRIIPVDNVSRDAERRTSQSGEVTYTAFEVGASDGWVLTYEGQWPLTNSKIRV